MQKTANYQLNQWEPTDKISRADFNADNAAIDAAIKAAADAAQAANTTAGAAQNTAQAAASAAAQTNTALTAYQTSNDAAVAKKAETDTVTQLSQKLSAAYTADNLPWEVGILDLSGAAEGDVIKTFDFTPSAVLVGVKGANCGFAVNGKSTRLKAFTSALDHEVTLSGNTLILDTYNVALSSTLPYLALK